MRTEEDGDKYYQKTKVSLKKKVLLIKAQN